MERDRVDTVGGGEQRELAGVSRSQHLLYVLPHDPAVIPQFLDPLLERLVPERATTQLLVLTSDVDTAVAVAAATMRRAASQPIRAVPVTSAARAARLLREPALVITGTPDELLELIRTGGSPLKLEDVGAVVVAWADSLLQSVDESTLQSLLGELPRGASRVVVASEITEALEDFVERHARRARRVGDVGVSEYRPLDMRYVTVSAEGRPRTLRRLLDVTDPERCAIYVRSEELREDVRTTVRALGYADDGPVVMTDGEPVEGALLVLYQLPPSREALRTVAAGAADVIALAQPRQLGALRALSSGGRLQPVQLPGAGAAARSREERMREEMRALLADGAPARELLALEPLLEEFDGVELAAAALALLERERSAARGSVQPAVDAAGAAGTVRVFISAGARDNIAARDLVGAIAGEAGIPGSRIGKIEIRDTHSLVELPADAAEEASRRLTGTVLRGRRLQARVDAARPQRPRERSEGGGFRGERDRGGERGEGRAAASGRRSPGGRGDGERGFERERGERRGRPDGRARPDDRDRGRGGGRGGVGGGGTSRPNRPRRD